MVTLLAILNFLLKWGWAILGVLALIFPNFVSTYILIPIVSNNFGAALVVVALAVLVFNFCRWIKGMVGENSIKSNNSNHQWKNKDKA